MARALAVLLIVGVYGASLMLTGWLRRNAEAHLFVDVPNSRSSHTIPPPRGGGVALVFTTLIAFVVAGWAGWLAWRSVWPICIGGGLVALVGFADDRSQVAPRWRLLGHFAAALAAIATMGGVPQIQSMGIVLNTGA